MGQSKISAYVVRSSLQLFNDFTYFLDDPEHVHARFVVADIQLRGMSGFDLRERLREEQPDLPVALITAHDEEETRARAGRAGCAGYFRKPFAGALLLETIRTALAPPGEGDTRRSPA